MHNPNSDFSKEIQDYVPVLLEKRCGHLVELGVGYNRNSERLIVSELLRARGYNAANQLINDMRLDEIFDFTMAATSQQK